MNKWIVLLICTIITGVNAVRAGVPDKVYRESIYSVKLFQKNNQSSPAVIQLGEVGGLELHFDDLDVRPRNYYYTYTLCNADWSPADVSVFDYIRGFNQNRLSQYRVSSLAVSKYVHYQAALPESNCMPAKSGNYLLKVFMDGDTSKLVFTKRMMVVQNQASIAARVVQPFDNNLIQTHQKIEVSANVLNLNVMSPQQLKLVILQNNRWFNAVQEIQPVFIRGKIYEYNAERDALFPAGKEFRWADLRSFRFESDRVERTDRTHEPNDIYIRPDQSRGSLRYLPYADKNGWMEISSTEQINPWWQSDYAQVHFRYVPSGNQPYAGKDVYLVGELTGNQVGDTSRMIWDASAGAYSKTMLLKQGYYSYNYLTATPDGRQPDNTLTEGNYWETENEYTILLYYRSLGGRHDELVAIRGINSRN